MSGRLTDSTIYDDREWRLGAPRLSLGSWSGEHGKWRYRESTYRNRISAVEVTEYEGRDGRISTTMRFALGEVEYVRNWDREFAPRRLAWLAREFVEEKTGLKVNG